MKQDFDSDNKLAALAGVCFAAGSLVPVISMVLFFVYGTTFEIEFVIFFIGLLPIFVAFLCGQMYGIDILNEKLVENSWQAIKKGIKVTLVSYAVYIPVFAILFALYQTLFHLQLGEWRTVAFFKNLVLGLIIPGFFGLLIIGWTLPLIGAAVGWLLFKFKLSRQI